ncbi:MAG TPA: GNAT family N-acetyltransferase [Chloroflexia bacterium]|nr:GNAT family N-acetyltransferase [Chloroflexia bacterium]
MLAQTTFKSRPYADDNDLPAIVELNNLTFAADGVSEVLTLDGMRMWVNRPERNPTRDGRLWEDANGRLVGYAHITIPKGGDDIDGFFVILVHPEARGTGIETEIIEWGTERLREDAQEQGKPAKLGSGVFENEDYYRRVLEQHGFEIVRYFFKMERPLNEPIPEPSLPEGFTIRHMDPNDEDMVARWVEMFNLSFIDHWGFHPATVENRKHRMSWKFYNPERDLIAVAPDGTLAAFCTCSVDPEENEQNNRSEGWIAVLGTRRGFRKIGLGRAMLLAGLQVLKEAGVQMGVLGVDAENPTGALRLYESVGFTRAKTEVAYEKKV